MALTAKITLYLTLLVFSFGQLFRLHIFSTSFPLLDITILSLFITNIIYLEKSNQLKIKNKPIFFFLIFSWITYLINCLSNSFFYLSSLFYLIRLNVLLSFFVFPISPKLLDRSFNRYFSLFLLSCVIFGLIQYLLWPDFTYFDSLNWDPHLYRLVGTFFDPTFTAQIFLSFLIFLFVNNNYKINFSIVITYLALALTYSRSALLGFVIAFSFISFKTKNPKTFFVSLIIFLLTLLALPRMPGEGTKLERTSSIKAKIENYQEAIKLIPTSPVIGIGYNNIAHYRTITDPNSHANSAFDSSLINILITTGIIGLSLFVIGLTTFFKKATLVQQTILVSLLFHSLFANSLFYPWTLLILFLV